MMLLGLRYQFVLLTTVGFAATLAGCQGDEGRPPPENVINIGFDGGTIGCSQPRFPAEQPDLSVLAPPIFLLTNTRSQQSSVGQAIVRPEEAIEAEVWVNGATRQLKVELANAWAPASVVYTTEAQTSGNEAVPVVLFTEPTTRGRYFMKLTLCGVDCEEREVVFDLHPCPDDPESAEPCGVNAPYDRTLIEDGEIVQRDGTCIDLGTTPGVGSGTVLVQ
jgi:hypothetical protein